MKRATKMPTEKQEDDKLDKEIMAILECVNALNEIESPGSLIRIFHYLHTRYLDRAYEMKANYENKVAQLHEAVKHTTLTIVDSELVRIKENLSDREQAALAIDSLLGIVRREPMSSETRAILQEGGIVN